MKTVVVGPPPAEFEALLARRRAAWLVDLITEAIEVWTAPGAEGYAESRRAVRDDETQVAGVVVAVEEILG